MYILDEEYASLWLDLSEYEAFWTKSERADVTYKIGEELIAILKILFS